MRVPVRTSAIGAAVLAAALAVSLLPAGVGAPSATAAAASYTAKKHERGALLETHRQRKVHRRPRVFHNRCLQRKARQWAAHLARPDVGLVHQNLRPVLRQCGARAVSENLARVPVSMTHPRKAVRLFMGSPPHRRNLLRRGSTHVGHATRYDRRTRSWITVQVFARKPGLWRRQMDAVRRRHVGISPQQFENRVLRQVSADRRRHHRRPLRLHRCLDRKAERWAARLAGTNTWRHQSLRSIRRQCGGKLRPFESLQRAPWHKARPVVTLRQLRSAPRQRRALRRPAWTHVGVAARWKPRSDRWVVVLVYGRY